MPPQTTRFDPPRRRGLVVHAAGLVVLGAFAAACLFFAFRQPVGGYFILLLMLSLSFLAPLLLVLYRGYALLRARYLVERDGLRLRWGLRVENIPIQEVEWVRPAQDLAFSLGRPLLSWPGALLGVVNNRELGPVEFMASSYETLLLVATPARIYAISPADPRGFVRSFRGATELGSIEVMDSLSVRPGAYLRELWTDRAARWMVSLSIGLAALLFVVISLAIPTRQGVSLGFSPTGALVEPVPAEQLLLLAVLAVFWVIVDLVGGLYFYNRSVDHIPAYLLWASGVLTPFLLLLAVGYIL